MQFRKLEIPGLYEIIPSKISDSRGYFSEIFRKDKFDAATQSVEFVQENQSLSSAVGTIRGIHFQSGAFAQGKLVRCISGAIFDAAVDLRHGSPTFGKWAAVELTPELNNQLWVPAGFGHAFCTLKPDTVVNYKVTNYYSAPDDGGVLWNDPDIGIVWPDVTDPEQLSAKDRVQPRLTDLPAHFHFEG